ncbi:MAG: LysE family translocator [Roseobacter sp.]
MIDPFTLAAFVPMALALNLTPGADMMFCIGQGLRFGPRAAWMASAGIAVGSLIHAVIAGAGLSALLANSPVAFDVIRWAGVAYLLWLAYQSLTATPPNFETPRVRSSQAFKNGLLVNLTNPKVILFILAFIPQFVRPDAGPILFQFFVFGAIVGVGGLAINGIVGMGVGKFSQRLARHARALNVLTAGIFTALAMRIALMERG